MCVLSEFCFGCTLRHGAIIASALTAIEALVLLTGAADDLQFAPLNNDRGVNILYIYGGVGLILGLNCVAIFICLVVGIIKKLSCFIMPWLFGWMINTIISFIFKLALVILGVHMSCIFVFVITFYIYLWIVVLNYYQELRDDPPAYTAQVKA